MLVISLTRMHPQQVHHRDEDYLNWIRRKESIVSGKFDSWDMDKGEGRNDPSHTWNTGKNGKRNDYTAVPLTRKEHTEYGNLGHDSFEKKYNIDFKDEIINLLSEYVEKIRK